MCVVWQFKTTEHFFVVKHLTKGKENYMCIKTNYDCDRKGMCNAIKLKDFGPSMLRWGQTYFISWGELAKVVKGKLVKG